MLWLSSLGQMRGSLFLSIILGLEDDEVENGVPGRMAKYTEKSVDCYVKYFAWIIS